MTRTSRTFQFLRVLGLFLLIAIPFVLTLFFQWYRTPERQLRFAGGQKDGFYDELSRSLATELRARGEITEASVVNTDGAFENLRLIQDEKVDFAFFQSGSDLHKDLDRDLDNVEFVSNVYPEVAHLIVRSDITDQQVDRFQFKSVSFGPKRSGSQRIGNALVEHLGWDLEKVEIKQLTFDRLADSFRNSEIELAIVNVKLGTRVVQQLLIEENCRLVDFPMRDAFLHKHIAYTHYKIPDGTYVKDGKQFPSRSVQSIAVNAQLITHQSTSAQSVQEVLRALHSKRFLRKNRLGDIYKSGNEYSTDRPEFDMHPAAKRYFEPDLQPWLNSEFVEATEGLRSFVFSALIAVYLFWRWWKQRNEQRKAHRLDYYIHRLLDIEQEQLPLDFDYDETQLNQLEKFIDEITELRRSALCEFSAHELKDDPAIECFVSMSHALSEKINSKLTRDAIRKNNRSEPTD